MIRMFQKVLSGFIGYQSSSADVKQICQEELNKHTRVSSTSRGFCQENIVLLSKSNISAVIFVQTDVSSEIQPESDKLYR